MKTISIIIFLFFLGSVFLFGQNNQGNKLKYLNYQGMKVHTDTLKTGYKMESFGMNKDSTLVRWSEYPYSKGLNIIFKKDGSIYAAGCCKRVVSFKSLFSKGHLLGIKKIGLWIEYDDLENKYINHYFYADKHKYYQIKTDEKGNIMDDEIWFRN
jgi:hypothetical protein